MPVHEEEVPRTDFETYLTEDKVIEAVRTYRMVCQDRAAYVRNGGVSMESIPKSIPALQVFPIQVLASFAPVQADWGMFPMCIPNVCVFGLHKSGTHLLHAYLSTFFEVNVQPANKGQGVTQLGGVACWKHHIPCRQTGPYVLPEGIGKGQKTVILITVREVRSWIAALSEGAYEIRPRSCSRRRHGWRTWMYGDIEVQHPLDMSYLEFDNIADMWAQAMYGYLTGGICAGSDVVRVAIVRFEDLLHEPEALMNRLERLGLRRKPNDFYVIEEPKGDCSQ